jgi:hypothetical protein
MYLKDKIAEVGGKLKKEKEVLAGNEGKDKLYISENSFSNETDAKRALADAKKRLFDVNSWSAIPGPGNAEFILFNRQGQPYKSEKPATGDFIKILLPGPVPENWVEVVDVSETEDSAEFTVRPSSDPTDLKQKEEVTEHFFRSDATSTFIVERVGSSVSGYELGLNEIINNQDEEAGGRAALNTMIAEGGWAFFQKIQWKNVTAYFAGIKR